MKTLAKHKKMKVITLIKITMVFAILMAIAFVHAKCTKPTQHKCTWEVCPMDTHPEEYSDEWCIKQIHTNQPDLPYEEAEYILEVDCKDSLLNN